MGTPVAHPMAAGGNDTVAMAARHQRERQRTAAPVLSKAHKSRSAWRRRLGSRGVRPQPPAATGARLENARRAPGRGSSIGSSRYCRVDRLHRQNQPRADVIGTLPIDVARACPVGASLLGQSDRWAVQRSRTLSIETVARQSMILPPASPTRPAHRQPAAAGEQAGHGSATPSRGSTSCQADDRLSVEVRSSQSRSGQAGTESCGRRGNAGSEV